MVRHVREVPEAVADGPQEHLEEVLEAEEFLADTEPNRTLTAFARVEPLEDDPLVLLW